MKTLPVGFLDSFGKRSWRKREIKDISKVFCLSNGMVLPFDEVGKTSEGAVRYPSGNIE